MAVYEMTAEELRRAIESAQALRERLLARARWIKR